VIAETEGTLHPIGNYHLQRKLLLT